MTLKSRKPIRRVTGRKNQPKDVSVINIMRFLQGGEANKTQIMASRGIAGIPNWKMNNWLDEMCDWEWISKKKSEFAGNVMVYSLLEKGRHVVNKMEEIDSKELLRLDFFKGIKAEF